MSDNVPKPFGALQDAVVGEHDPAEAEVLPQREAEASHQAIPKHAWDRAVDDWVNAHVRSSPITQGTFGAWEHLNEALPKLKEFLECELKG
jgi:hypothetical protein